MTLPRRSMAARSSTSIRPRCTASTPSASSSFSSRLAVGRLVPTSVGEVVLRHRDGNRRLTRSAVHVRESGELAGQPLVDRQVERVEEPAGQRPNLVGQGGDEELVDGTVPLPEGVELPAMDAHRLRRLEGDDGGVPRFRGDERHLSEVGARPEDGGRGDLTQRGGDPHGHVSPLEEVQRVARVALVEDDVAPRVASVMHRDREDRVPIVSGEALEQRPLHSSSVTGDRRIVHHRSGRACSAPEDVRSDVSAPRTAAAIALPKR